MIWFRISMRLLGCLMVALVSRGLSAGEIRLKAECLCSSSVVRLQDVAEIVPDAHTSAAKVRQLGAIPLMPAPTPGRTRELRHQEVRELLGLNGIDLREYRVVGASSVKLRGGRPSAPVTTPAKKSSEQVVVAVTTRTVERGERLQPADVTLAPIAAAAAAQLPRSVEQVVGWEVLRPLESGQPVRTSDLRKPLLIRRNSVVQVTARAAGVQVRTQAKALEDGALGDVVLLESLETRQKYSGRVVDTDRVDVYASGVTLPAEPQRPGESLSQATDVR